MSSAGDDDGDDKYREIFEASKRLLSEDMSNSDLFNEGGELHADCVIIINRHLLYTADTSREHVKEMVDLGKDVNISQFLKYLVYMDIENSPGAQNNYLYTYKRYVNEWEKAAIGRSTEEAQLWHKWSLLRKYIQGYVSERNFAWLTFNNIVKYHNNHSHPSAVKLPIWSDINQKIIFPISQSDPSDPRDQPEKQFMAKHCIDYLQRCVDFRFREVHIDDVIDIFVKGVKDGKDKAEKESIEKEKETNKEALRKNPDFLAQFEDFQIFYAKTFHKLIRFEVMRCLDVLFLLFQSNRYYLGNDSERSALDKDPDIRTYCQPEGGKSASISEMTTSKTFKVYLERVTVMFEKLLVRSDKKNDCHCNGNWEKPRDAWSKFYSCNICFVKGQRGLDGRDSLEDCWDGQRYEHLLEPCNDMKELQKGVASKFLILCAQIIGIINLVDPYKSNLVDLDYSDALKWREGQMICFGQFEQKGFKLEEKTRQQLFTSFKRAHWIWVSEPDKGYLQALFYLMDPCSLNFIKDYVEKIKDLFIIDTSYSYSDSCNNDFLQSYFYSSYDDCSKSSIPDIFVSYSRVIWIDAITYIYNNLYLRRKSYSRHSNGNKEEGEEDKIIENILKLVCDICFHFDPLLMKESFWMCFETGVKFMLKKKKKSSKEKWKNMISISNFDKKVMESLRSEDEAIIQLSEPPKKDNLNKKSKNRESESKYLMLLGFPLREKKQKYSCLFERSVVSILYFVNYLLRDFRDKIDYFLILLSSVLYDFKSAKLVLDLLSLKHEVKHSINRINQSQLKYLVTGSNGSIEEYSFDQLISYIKSMGVGEEEHLSTLLPRILQGKDVKLDQSKNIDEFELNVSQELIRPRGPSSSSSSSSFSSFSSFSSSSSNDSSYAVDGYREGDKVEANYRGVGKWCPGRISKVNKDGTYDIAYSDGGKDAVKSFSNFEPHNGTRGVIQSYSFDDKKVEVFFPYSDSSDSLEIIINSIVRGNLRSHSRAHVVDDNTSGYAITLITNLLKYYDDEEGYRVEIDDDHDPTKKTRVFTCKSQYRSQISSLEFQDYAETFAYYDDDGSEAIDKNEMINVFEEQGLFKELGDFEIDESSLYVETKSSDEFLKLKKDLQEKMERKKEDMIDKLYKEIDQDDNGEIDFDEFIQFMLMIKSGQIQSKGYQDLIHTDIQDTGIKSQVSRRFKKCIQPIQIKFETEVESKRSFDYSATLMETENIYFVASIFTSFQLLFFDRPVDFSRAFASSLINHQVYGEDDDIEELKMKFFQKKNFMLLLIECMNHNEFSNDLCMFLIEMLSSKTFLSDMLLVQRSIENDIFDGDLFEIEVSLMYECIRLIGILLETVIENSFVTSASTFSSAYLDSNFATDEEIKRKEIEKDVEKIIDFFFEIYYSFTRIDFGVNFVTSNYCSRHRVISLCIDILAKITQIQANSSPALKYVLDKIFVLDSRGIRTLNWLINTALNPILVGIIQTVVHPTTLNRAVRDIFSVNATSEWWSSFDVSDFFVNKDFLDKNSRPVQIICSSLLKDIVMVSNKSSSFIVHLLSIARHQKSKDSIFSIITDLFSSDDNFVCIYKNEPVKANLLTLLCKQIDVESVMLHAFKDEIKKNGLTLLNSILDVMSRSSSNSLSFIITTSVGSNRQQVRNLSSSLAFIFYDYKSSPESILAAIDLLIYCVHSSPLDVKSLFLDDVGDKLLTNSLISLIKDSKYFYKEHPKVLFNIQRLILAMIKNVQNEHVNKALFSILFPNSDRNYYDGKSFWDCICSPLTECRRKPQDIYNQSPRGDEELSDLDSFDLHKLDLIRQLVPAVSESSNNSFLNSNNNDAALDFQVLDEVEFCIEGVDGWRLGIIESVKVKDDEKEASQKPSNRMDHSKGPDKKKKKEMKKPSSVTITYPVKINDSRSRSAKVIKDDKNKNEIRKLDFERLCNETVLHSFKLMCHAMSLELLTQFKHGSLNDLGIHSYVAATPSKQGSIVKLKNANKFLAEYAEVVEMESRKCKLRFENSAIPEKYIDVKYIEHVRKKDKDKGVTMKEEFNQYLRDHSDIFITQFDKTCRIYSKVSGMFVKSLEVLKTKSADKDNDLFRHEPKDNLVDSIYEKLHSLRTEAKDNKVLIDLDVNLFTFEYSDSEENFWPILSQDVCIAPSTLYLKSFLPSDASSSKQPSAAGAAAGGGGVGGGVSATRNKSVRQHFTARKLPNFGKDYFFNTSLLSHYSNAQSSIQTVQDLIVDMTTGNFMWSLLDSQATVLQCYKRFVQLIVPENKKLNQKRYKEPKSRSSSYGDNDSDSDDSLSGMNTPDSRDSGFFDLSSGANTPGGFSTPGGMGTPGGLFSPDYSGLQTPDTVGRGASGGSGGGGGKERSFPGKTRSKQAIVELLKSLKDDLDLKFKEKETKKKTRRKLKSNFRDQGMMVEKTDLGGEEFLSSQYLYSRDDEMYNVDDPHTGTMFELFICLQKFELLLGMINYRLNDSFNDKKNEKRNDADLPKDVNQYLKKILDISKTFSKIFEQIGFDNNKSHGKKDKNNGMVSVLFSLTRSKLVNIILLCLQTLIDEDGEKVDGRILRDHKDGTYDIIYDDGKYVEHRVPRNEISDLMSRAESADRLGDGERVKVFRKYIAFLLIDDDDFGNDVEKEKMQSKLKSNLLLSIFDIAKSALKENFDIFGIRVLCKKSKYISNVVVGKGLSENERENIHPSILGMLDSLELNDSCGGNLSEMCLQLIRSCISILFNNRFSFKARLEQDKALDEFAAQSVRIAETRKKILYSTHDIVRNFIDNWAPILSKLSVDDCLYVHDYNAWRFPEIDKKYTKVNAGSKQNSDSDTDSEEEYAIGNMVSEDPSIQKKDHKIFSSKKKSRDSGYNTNDIKDKSFKDMFTRETGIESLVSHLQGLNGSAVIQGFSEIVLALLQGFNTTSMTSVFSQQQQSMTSSSGGFQAPQYFSVQVDFDKLFMSFIDSLTTCPLLKAFKQILTHGSLNSDGSPQDKNKVRILSSVYMGYDISKYESSVCEYWKLAVTFGTEMIYRYCKQVTSIDNNEMSKRVVSFTKHFINDYSDLLLLPFVSMKWRYHNSLQQCKLSTLSMHFFSMVYSRIPALKLDFKDLDCELTKIVDQTLCFLTKTFFNLEDCMKDSQTRILDVDDRRVRKEEKEEVIQTFQLYYLERKFKSYSKLETVLRNRSHTSKLNAHSENSYMGNVEVYQMSFFIIACEKSLIELFEVIARMFLSRVTYTFSEHFPKKKKEPSYIGSYNLGLGSPDGGGGGSSSLAYKSSNLTIGTEVFYHLPKEAATDQDPDRKAQIRHRSIDPDGLPPWGFIQRCHPELGLYHIMSCNLKKSGFVPTIEASVHHSCILNKPRPLLKISKSNENLMYPHLYLYRSEFYDDHDNNDNFDEGQNDIMTMKPQVDLFAVLSTPHHQRTRQGSDVSVSSVLSRASSFDSTNSDQGSIMSGKKRLSVQQVKERKQHSKENLSKNSKKFHEEFSENCSIFLLLSSLKYLINDEKKRKDRTLRYKDTYGSLENLHSKFFESKAVFENFQSTFYCLSLSIILVLFNEICFYWEIYNFYDDREAYKIGEEYDEKYVAHIKDQFNRLKLYSAELLKIMKRLLESSFSSGLPPNIISDLSYLLRSELKRIVEINPEASVVFEIGTIGNEVLLLDSFNMFAKKTLESLQKEASQKWDPILKSNNNSKDETNKIPPLHSLKRKSCAINE